MDGISDIPTCDKNVAIRLLHHFLTMERKSGLKSYFLHAWTIIYVRREVKTVNKPKTLHLTLIFIVPFKRNQFLPIHNHTN